MLIGRGEYYNIDNEDNSVETEAYGLFWYYIQKCVPEVVSQIESDIFPVYCNMLDLLKKKYPDFSSDVGAMLNIGHNEAIVKELNGLINKWINKWHLDGLERIYRTIYDILEQWYQYPSFKGQLSTESFVSKLTTKRLPENLQKFNFKASGWIGEMETEHELVYTGMDLLLSLYFQILITLEI